MEQWLQIWLNLGFHGHFFYVKNQLDFSEKDFLPYMIEILSTSMHRGNYLHNSLYLKENSPRKVRRGGKILMLYVHLFRYDRFQLYILIV